MASANVIGLSEDVVTLQRKRETQLYGDVFLLERDGAEPQRAERLAFGETAGRNEAWLRDTLFAHPELLPIREIDPSFASPVALCTELRTEAGPLDIAFINEHGRLILVECKLWRNPEARRKVVAQVLDYARAISRWSYSDLQRQVSAATGEKGNVPFERVKRRHSALIEQRFVDDAARAIRDGRFLLIIAGDGIREDVNGIAELINRNAASAFSFGLLEVALYGFDDASLAIQPRVVAKTQLIERTVVMVRQEGAETSARVVDESDMDEVVKVTQNAQEGAVLGESPKQASFRQWWTPVLEAGFDDPDQEPAKLYYPNHVRVQLPWPTRAYLVAYRLGGDGGELGVYLVGKELLSLLQSDHVEICSQLPAGTVFRKFESSDGFTFITKRRAAEFVGHNEMRTWLIRTLNAYVNVLRPRLNALTKELR